MTDFINLYMGDMSFFILVNVGVASVAYLVIEELIRVAKK